MKILHIGEKEYQLPGHLNEMTVNQLISLSALVATEIPIQEIKIKMLFHCLKANVKHMRNEGYYRIRIGKHVFALTVEQVMNASGAFDYLFTAPNEDGQCFFDNRLTVNPYPQISIGRKVHFSPEDALTDIAYNRYIYLETYHSVMAKKPETVYAFMACMFRRNKYEFNPAQLDIERMHKLKPEVMVLMLWFYMGSIRFIADKFQRIYPLEGEPTTGEVNVYDSQQKLLDYISAGDPTKKRLNKEDKLYDILYSLDYMMELQETKTTD